MYTGLSHFKRLVAPSMKSTLELKVKGQDQFEVITTGLTFTNKTIQLNEETEGMTSDGRKVLVSHSTTGEKWIEIEKWSWGDLKKSAKYVRQIEDGKLIEVIVL